MVSVRGVVFAVGYAILLFHVFAASAMAFELGAARPHVTLNIASYHVNATQDFNELNPGIGAGFSLPVNGTTAEIDLEFGQYRNSLSKNSVYLMGALDAQIATLGPRFALRAGLFTGFAHYPGDAKELKGRGVPTLGNWVMAAGAQITLRHSDTTDIRLRVMPAGDVADGLFTLQLARHF